MTQWKPTKAGIYRLNNEEAGICTVMSTGELRVLVRGGPESTPLVDGPWSLMGPDWQPGAPTEAQLERWKWWAVTSRDSGTVVQLVCGDCSLRHGVLVVGMSVMDPSVVFESAPIQEDMSNGPLWVPMEVANG